MIEEVGSDLTRAICPITANGLILWFDEKHYFGSTYLQCILKAIVVKRTRRCFGHSFRNNIEIK